MVISVPGSSVPAGSRVDVCICSDESNDGGGGWDAIPSIVVGVDDTKLLAGRAKN